MASPGAPLTPSVRSWLSALFEQTVEGAYNVAYRIVWSHADAMDVVQSAFVNAARHHGQLRDPSRSRSWLLGIAYREALMVLRSRRDSPTDPAELPERTLSGADPADASVQLELARLLDEAIGGLPDSLRVAFVLRDVEELPMRDVAQVLDIGESAAKMRVARARESLRIALDGRI
ncbi:MAG: sigma-70 family RNA polymerase sigma factor [Ilumatobacteraceae bacterium]